MLENDLQANNTAHLSRTPHLLHRFRVLRVVTHHSASEVLQLVRPPQYFRGFAGCAPSTVFPRFCRLCALHSTSEVLQVVRLHNHSCPKTRTPNSELPNQEKPMNRLPFTLLLFPAIATASLSVDGLRCEFLKNPVGVENPSPRFSWIAHESDTSRRGQDITGFEIRVAKTVDGLGSETGCLWQTKGKGRDLAVCYQGPALDSGRAYFWKVRATDVDGILSPWSPPARFVLALQKRDEWSGAQWIGEPGVIPSALNAFHLTAKVSNIQDAFGIFFHASDASNACLWQFNRVVSGKLCLRPHIFQSGNPQFLPQTEIESKFPELCDWSKPHTVELDVKGETVRTFWDGKLVDERNQKPLEHGLFGFRTSASEGVDVHQLTVTDATGKPMIDERFQKRETCIFRDAEIKNGILILRGKSILRFPRTAHASAKHSSFKQNRFAKHTPPSSAWASMSCISTENESTSVAVNPPPTPTSARS